MTDPYAPKAGRTRRLSDVASPLDTFCGRLAQLGADDDTIATVRENWEPVDDEDRADRERALGASDDELRALIREVEDEHRANLSTIEEQAEQERAAILAELPQARIEANGTVGSALAWVNAAADPRARAVAMLLAEAEPEAQHRVTLVAGVSHAAGEWVDHASYLTEQGLPPEPSVGGEPAGSGDPADAPDGERTAPADGVEKEAIEVPPDGTTATLTNDGSGTALPPAE